MYSCRRGSDQIRIIVARQLPAAEHNALLHLLSAVTEQVVAAARQYRPRSPHSSTLVKKLIAGYLEEGFPKPYTLEDFARDYAMEHFTRLTPKERHELLQKLPPEERLKGLPPEERLKGLSRAEIEHLIQNLKTNGSTTAE